jgi:tRNA-splicing ligase RtcB
MEYVMKRDHFKVPVKLWLNDLETSAIEQAVNVAKLPFVYSQVAIMPDGHQGYGVGIGTVFATNDVIIPNAVGVDIGCGMTAVKLDVNEEFIRTYYSEILEFCHNRGILSIRRNSILHGRGLSDIDMPFTNVILEHASNASKQLGTLGGGNHFIEFQKDEDGHIWLMVHSGSRNLGKQVADHYNKVAVYLNEKYHSAVPKELNLAFLPLRSKEGQDYLTDMQFCVEYALYNRAAIIEDITDLWNMSIIEDINCSHNFARMENHFGKNVMVHRKGATSARKNELGLIPGSQGANSYVVKGLGNNESFHSCSHGAGRVLSRTKAKNELSLQEQQEILNAKNVMHTLHSEDDLDEAPGAYKNIDKVMELQKDLVEIVHTLEPIAVIKN